MKGYALVREHPTHFEVSHPKEGVFKVAKKGLDASTVKKIKALPQAMADGGEVEGDDPPAPDMPGGAPPPSPATTGDALEDQPELPMAGTPPAALAAKPDAPTTFAGTPPPGPSGGAPAEALTEPPMAPALGRDNPNTTFGVLRSDQNGTPGKDPFAGLQGSYDSAFGKIAGGINAEAKAQSDYAKSAGDAQRVLTEGLQKAKQTYDRRFAEVDAENKQLTQDVMNAKIDPTRVWASATTGNKIMAGIGILLSGIGSGMTGQQNMALDVINKTIERDIDAQKAELGKKETLLSMNYRKYGNLTAAYQATSAQLTAIAQGQIGQAAAKMGGDVAQAKAQQAIGQLDIQKTQMQQSLAMFKLKQQVIGGGAGSSPQDFYIMNQLFPGQVVNVPGAGLKVAATPEDAKEVKKAQESAIRLKKTLARARTFNQNVAGTLGTMPGSANDAEAESIYNQLIPQIQEFNGLTRLTETDKGIDEKAIVNPGTIRTSRFTKVMDTLDQAIDDRLNATYGQRLINHNPDAVSGQFQGVK